MHDPLSHELISIEAKNLSPEDRTRLADHIATYKQIYNVFTQVEIQALEDLSLSSLKIERIDETIAKIHRTIRAESGLAWDSVVASRIGCDKKQFAGPKSQPQWAAVRTSQLAREIAARWQQFAEFVACGKKHLIPLDLILDILNYEGHSHRLDSLDARALWLASRFLAHNSRKHEFVTLWLKINKIRDTATTVALLDDLTSQWPDQAAADSELHAHALARANFWLNHAQALEADSIAEKQAFLESFQGSRQSREQLRFQQSCRRHEVAQNSRLRRLIERLLKSREVKSSAKSTARSAFSSGSSFIAGSNESEHCNYLESLPVKVSDCLTPEPVTSAETQTVTTHEKQSDIEPQPRKSRFSDAEKKEILDAVDEYVKSFPVHVRNSPEFEARVNDPWFMVEAANARRIKNEQADGPLLLSSEIPIDTGPITFAHLGSKAVKGPHVKDQAKAGKSESVKELPRRMFKRDRTRGRPLTDEKVVK